MPKVLIITPKFPFPSTGACEQDRWQGIQDFLRYGYDVHIIGMVHQYQDKELIQKEVKKIGASVTLVDYMLPKQRGIEKLFSWMRRILFPLYLDGAVFEYTNVELKKQISIELRKNKPDFVWIDYTFLWPIYFLIKRRGVSIITRSHNFEPKHFLEESGGSFLNYLKFLPKFFNEIITLNLSDIFFSITPFEYDLYKKINLKTLVRNLPLRGLPPTLSQERVAADSKPLQVVFMGSTYSVNHNLSALKFILHTVLPRLQKEMPGVFVFNILGGKVPPDLIKSVDGNIVKFHGYIPNEQYVDFLDSMDIAVVPSLFGSGMQQKVFESLCRGFPTITSGRSIAGYPFVDGTHLLFAETDDQFISALRSLTDFTLRDKLSRNASSLSQRIFSQKALDEIVLDSLENLAD